MIIFGTNSFYDLILLYYNTFAFYLFYLQNVNIISSFMNFFQ